MPHRAACEARMLAPLPVLLCLAATHQAAAVSGLVRKEAQPESSEQLHVPSDALLSGDMNSSQDTPQEEPCSYEIVQTDSRNMTNLADAYWSKMAVINHAYAKKHGYAFTRVRVQGNITGKGHMFRPPWAKVFYFRDRLHGDDAHKGAQTCKWLVYIDADAYFRNFTRPLHEVIPNLISQYKMKDDIGAILAREQPVGRVFNGRYKHINTGVMFVKINSKARKLFDTWAQASQDDSQLMREWPWEQGVLTQLYFPHAGLQTRPFGFAGSAHVLDHGDITSLVGLVNYTDINSPWGEFIRHLSRFTSEERAAKASEAMTNLSIAFDTSLNELDAVTEDWVMPNPLPLIPSRHLTMSIASHEAIEEHDVATYEDEDSKQNVTSDGGSSA